MPDRSPLRQPVVIRNNTAIFLWGFMAVWMAMLGCFTYIFLRDGGIPQVGMFGAPLMAFFWLCGLGATGWALSHPLIRVTVSARGVVARERWLWRTRERHYRAGRVAVPEIVARTDSEGDPYFICLLALPDGEPLAVAEAHMRPAVETVRQRLLSALGAVS
jgi:hypothetical protein